jgi:membrane-associated phospholipid phosphatase
VGRVNARTVNALRAAAACVAGLLVLYLAAFVIAPTEHADQRVLDGFLSLQSPAADAWAGFVVGFFNLAPYAVAVLIVVAVALGLDQPRRAAAVVAICFGANVTTQALKLLTAAPREPQWLADASWPSGHLTAATSLALCVVLIAPPLLRPYAAGAGVLGVLATAYSILVVGSHHPTDVVGGMLMAGLWTALGVAALELAEQRWPSGRPSPAPSPRGLTISLALAAATASVFALLVLVTHVSSLSRFASDHTTFVAGALLLTACGAALPAAAALAPRRRAT